MTAAPNAKSHEFALSAGVRSPILRSAAAAKVVPNPAAATKCFVIASRNVLIRFSPATRHGGEVSAIKFNNRFRGCLVLNFKRGRLTIVSTRRDGMGLLRFLCAGVTKKERTVYGFVRKNCSRE